MEYIGGVISDYLIEFNRDNDFKAYMIRWNDSEYLFEAYCRYHIYSIMIPIEIVDKSENIRHFLGSLILASASMIRHYVDQTEEPQGWTYD